MCLTFEDRVSDSPFIERVWRSHSRRGGTFLSLAACHFEMAVTRHRGTTFITELEHPPQGSILKGRVAN